MGANFDYNSINYRNQSEVDTFLSTTFDRYDRNRDGVIDYREFQLMKDDIYQMITRKYGYGPTADKLRAALPALNVERGKYITRNEFIYKAKYEVQNLLTSLNYTSGGGYYSGMSGIYAPPSYGYGNPSYGGRYGASPTVIPPTTKMGYV